jgi:methylthioribose-1-phosphate isomerase
MARIPDVPPDSPTDGEASAPTGGDVPGADVGRRRFFRQFAGELIQGAASVAGAAQALQRISAEAAGAILDPESVATTLPAAGAPDAPRGFRSAFRWDEDGLVLVDQRKLPDALVDHRCDTAASVAFAIRELIVRGAPAVGQVAAIGLVLTALRVRDTKPYARRATLRGAANALVNARPTAANVRWAVDRVMARYYEIGELSEEGSAIAEAMRAEAQAIVFEATTDHGRLADFGIAALPVPEGRPLRVLTHGNTGPLACGQFGTALGIVLAAHHAGREVHVWVDETRPSLDGARLTAWELAQAGVPHTLIADAAAGSLMRAGEVDVVLVGADRVAANGDTANEVGTYPLAVLAARHGIPFHVCAPLSSVDLESAEGSAIPIEERAAREVVELRGDRIAPPDTPARNPSSDVTPADLVSGIVTEEGVLTAPFRAGFETAMARARERWAAMPRFDQLAGGAR